MGLYQKILGIFIYSLASLFLLYEMALQVFPSILTEHLMQQFQVGAIPLSVASASYFYSYSLMQIPAGLLFDRFSAKKLLSGAILLCSIGTFFFILTQQVVWAAFGRFLMGIGSSFAFVGVLVLASRWFSQKIFPFLVGLAQFLAAMGALAGELPLTFLIEKWPWHRVMLLFGLFGLFLALLCALVVQNPPHLTAFFSSKRESFLNQFQKMLRLGQTWWLALYGFCSWGPAISFAALWGVPYLKTRFQLVTSQAAHAMAFFWIGVAICSPLIGWVSKKIGNRRLLMMGCSGIGVLSSLTLFYAPQLPVFLAFLLLFGIGVGGSGQILSFSLIKDLNPPQTIGTAVGFNNMAVVGGGALFQPLTGFFLDFFWMGERGIDGVPVYSLLNYHVGFFPIPLCFLIGLVVILFFIKEKAPASR